MWRDHILGLSAVHHPDCGEAIHPLALILQIPPKKGPKISKIESGWWLYTHPAEKYFCSSIKGWFDIPNISGNINLMATKPATSRMNPNTDSVFIQRHFTFGEIDEWVNGGHVPSISDLAFQNPYFLFLCTCPIEVIFESVLHWEDLDFDVTFCSMGAHFDVKTKVFRVWFGSMAIPGDTPHDLSTSFVPMTRNDGATRERHGNGWIWAFLSDGQLG